MTAVLLISCGTTEKSMDDDDPSAGFEYSYDLREDYEDEELDEVELLLLRTRSSLSNHYSENVSLVPEIFLQEIVMDERHSDPYAGFRVQLMTTRSVAEADSIRDHFVAWADTTIAGYEPDAYVIFRSPNYRVRAGDFQNRDRAIQFSNMLKSRYPDAWVVHERIEPSKVPDETAKIQFKELMPVDLEEEIQMLEEVEQPPRR